MGDELVDAVGCDGDPVLVRSNTRYADPRSAQLLASIDDLVQQARLLPGQLDPLLRLLVAAAIGLLITAVHRPFVADRPMGRSMQQAQILLAVAGAMIMIIIGNNVARAFGIAGAASIIRFRTPVDDPKDVTILFLLMGLGMSAGLGFYAVAGMGLLYLAAAVTLGAVFLWRAYILWRQSTSPEGSLAQAIRLYRYSISYLTLLFAAVAVDSLLAGRLA